MNGNATGAATEGVGGANAGANGAGGAGGGLGAHEMAHDSGRASQGTEVSHQVLIFKISYYVRTDYSIKKVGS